MLEWKGLMFLFWTVDVNVAIQITSYAKQLSSDYRLKHTSNMYASQTKVNTI